MWLEYCHPVLNTWLEITATTPTTAGCQTALGSLAPRLTAVCCRPEDGAECGHNIIPTECSVDCASLWASYAAQCPAERNLGNVAMTAFLEEDCGVAGAALAVLEATATIQDSQYHVSVFLYR